METNVGHDPPKQEKRKKKKKGGLDLPLVLINTIGKDVLCSNN